MPRILDLAAKAGVTLEGLYIFRLHRSTTYVDVTY